MDKEILLDKVQPSFDTNRTVLGKVYPLRTPFTIILDSSEVCNFKCEYCFRAQEDLEVWGYAKNGKLMSKEVFELAVDQIKEFKEAVKVISLSNHGEPLCNRRLPDMVRYIKTQGIKSRVSIHTNGSLLDYEYALDLADSNIDRIVVSLQGLSSKKYNDVCGAKVDFEELYENLKVFYEHKKNTQLCIKIMDVALDEGEDNKFYEKFSKIGDRVYIEKMVPIWKEVDLSGLSAAEEKLAYNKYGSGFPRQECCPLIFNTIVITPDGEVYPCTQLMSPYRLGNINDKSIKWYWDCNQRKELLVKQCKKENPEICKDCFILQNSIYTKEDMIDEYRFEILERIKESKY